MENKNEYSFLKEKIKDKPFNWKHLWQKACLIAGAGILFGICACIACLLYTSFMMPTYG